MKGAAVAAPLALFSPAKRVRAELAVETVWIGSTVYPACPVWRVWVDGCAVVDTSTAGLMAGDGPLGYGMRLVKATRHRPQTGIGPGRSLVARFAARDGRELELTLRVTDLSAFCAVRQPRTRRSATEDIGVTCFPEGSVLLGAEGTLNAQRSTFNAQGLPSNDPGAELTSDLRPLIADPLPQVRFTPDGKGVAFWRHGLERHVVFFDRPGDLAERRFAAVASVAALNIADGRLGCEHLFLTVPFTRSALPTPAFGAALTPAYRAAFEALIDRDTACDAFWMMRGEPGEFAVGARRQGAVWRVAGVTAAAKTLTVRVEDLWLRTPAEWRARRYTVEILRDPLPGEAGPCVNETFAAQAPDVRVALDLARDGGFLLTLRPQP